MTITYNELCRRLDQITPQEFMTNPILLQFAERVNYTKWI